MLPIHHSFLKLFIPLVLAENMGLKLYVNEIAIKAISILFKFHLLNTVPISERKVKYSRNKTLYAGVK